MQVRASLRVCARREAIAAEAAVNGRYNRDAIGRLVVEDGLGRMGGGGGALLGGRGGGGAGAVRVLPQNEGELDDGERQVYYKLREWTHRKAEEEETEAYMVAQKRTLLEIVRMRPEIGNIHMCICMHVCMYVCTYICICAHCSIHAYPLYVFTWNICTYTHMRMYIERKPELHSVWGYVYYFLVYCNRCWDIFYLCLRL